MDLTAGAQRLQSAFLRLLLGLPNSVSAFAMYQLASLSWLRIFKFWLCLFFRAQEWILVHLLLSNNFLLPWFLKINNKLKSIGLAIEFFENLGEKQVYNIIRQRILDIDYQNTVAGAHRTCSPFFKKYLPSNKEDPRVFCVVNIASPEIFLYTRKTKQFTDGSD